MARPLPTSRLSLDEPEDPTWLWRDTIPLAAVTLVQGDGSVGKSTFTRWLAARVSRGELEGDLHGQPAATLWLNVEEHVGRDIRRGVDRQGGDPDLIWIWRPSRQLRLPRFPRDLDRLRDAVIQRGARLVVVDQISAFLSGGERAIRDALLGFREITESCGCTFIGTRNLNGRKGVDCYRRGRGGSLLADIARFAFHLDFHPDGDGSRVLVRYKPKDPVPSQVFATDDAGRLVVGEQLEIDPDELLALQRSRFAERATTLADAVAFVREYLTGREVPTNELNDAAAERWFSLRTVERARAELGALHRAVWQRQPDGSTVHMTLLRLPDYVLPPAEEDPGAPPTPPSSPPPAIPTTVSAPRPAASVPNPSSFYSEIEADEPPSRGSAPATEADDPASERFKLLELDRVPDVGGVTKPGESNGVRTPPTNSANGHVPP